MRGKEKRASCAPRPVRPRECGRPECEPGERAPIAYTERVPGECVLGACAPTAHVRTAREVRNTRYVATAAAAGRPASTSAHLWGHRPNVLRPRGQDFKRRSAGRQGRSTPLQRRVLRSSGGRDVVVHSGGGHSSSPTLRRDPSYTSERRLALTGWRIEMELATAPKDLRSCHEDRTTGWGNAATKRGGHVLHCTKFARILGQPSGRELRAIPWLLYRKAPALSGP